MLQRVIKTSQEMAQDIGLPQHSRAVILLPSQVLQEVILRSHQKNLMVDMRIPLAKLSRSLDVCVELDHRVSVFSFSIVILVIEKSRFIKHCLVVDILFLMIEYELCHQMYQLWIIKEITLR